MLSITWEPDPERPDRVCLRRVRPVFLPEGDGENPPETLPPEHPGRRRVRQVLGKLP